VQEETASAGIVPRLAGVGLVAAVALLLLVPAFAGRFPPVLDLPQQAAQIRMFAEAWRHADGVYRIQWAAPNKLSYPILGAALALGGSVWGPRCAIAACGALFAGAIFWIARRRGRPAEHAALAAIFVYTGSFYGGFLNFVVGAAALALWLEVIADERDLPFARAVLRHLAAAAALYLAHTLWLLGATAVLVVAGPRRREPRRYLAAALGLAPFLLAAAAWVVSFQDSRWQSGALYQPTILERLKHVRMWPTWLLGALDSRWEPALLGALALWALVAAWGWRLGRGAGDRWLLRVAGAFALLALLLPEKLGDTVLFARRWGPWAAICTLLALPPLPFPVAWRRGLAAAIVAAHALVTLAAWRAFDRDEMRGLAAALEAVPEGSRLLGLDYLRRSPRFQPPLFFHAAAYAQLDRQVTLGYSFAGTPSSLVVFRDRRSWPWPWTQGLEENPNRLRPADLDHFDLLLIHAAPTWHVAAAERAPRLAKVAGEGAWWLYRVRPASLPKR
jgi:hypothetical protein